MGGQKPHLLVADAQQPRRRDPVSYAPSTKFYLADKRPARPGSRGCRSRCTWSSGWKRATGSASNRFVTRYAYHHGYFDGDEREFRGFGMVEQWDTEEFAALNPGDNYPDATNLDAASHVPPVYTRTWFHTGAYLQGGRISRYFENQYYEENDPSLGPAVLNEAQLAAMRLDDTILPTSAYLPDNTRILHPASGRGARSLPGAQGFAPAPGGLRVGRQPGRRPAVPRLRAQYTIELLQPRAGSRYAVFYTHKREVVDFYYERALYSVAGQSLADPRVHHTLELATDYFGSSLQSAAVGYGRRHPDPDPLLTAADQAQQSRLRLTCDGEQLH